MTSLPPRGRARPRRRRDGVHMNHLVPAVLLLAFSLAAPAAAQNSVALEEVLARWQGDDQVQFVELHMLAAGQNQLSNGAGLVFFDAAGSAATARIFRFQLPDPTVATAGARVLIATARLATVAGVTADYVLEPGVLAPGGGRVCYFTASTSDCVAYGNFSGDNGDFGRPTRLTPDNRSLDRVDHSGDSRADWDTALSPTPQNNAGQVGAMPTLCGNQELSQGEACDGDLLDGQSCKSLGFARGHLRCAECHFDTSGCTLCGNDSLDAREECDGIDLADKTCEALGFVAGGTLACTDKCKLDTSRCGDTFLVPGGGPVGTDCIGEWRVVNGSARPTGNGKTKLLQSCKDGDTSCDADAASGTCTFSVGVCLARHDERIAGCAARSVESWALVRPRAEKDADLTARMVAAVTALGPSTPSGTTVTFAPALDATERCTDDVAVVVPVGHAVKLMARITAAGGKRRDADALKLACRR